MLKSAILEMLWMTHQIILSCIKGQWVLIRSFQAPKVGGSALVESPYPEMRRLHLGYGFALQGSVTFM